MTLPSFEVSQVIAYFEVDRTLYNRHGDISVLYQPVQQLTRKKEKHKADLSCDADMAMECHRIAMHKSYLYTLSLMVSFVPLSFPALHDERWCNSKFHDIVTPKDMLPMLMGSLPA